MGVPRDFIDADAMYEARFERDETHDSFDSGWEDDGGWEDDEPDDSHADAEALASAGMGTDEDYGFFGGEE